MDRRHAQQQIATAYARFLRTYPDTWRQMLAAWQTSSTEAAGWLLYAANYLFSTGGVRWAVDPIVPTKLLPELRDDLPTAALANLSFLLLTHAHADHLDEGLLQKLRGTQVRFVVPECLVDRVRDAARPANGQLVVARPREVLRLDDIEVLPISGRHWEPRTDRRVGIEALGYRVRVGTQHWLFPGDVRDYRPDALADHAPVDIVFAHLWLGRERALDPEPPLCDAFVDFLRGARPRTVVLAHLDEFSRTPEDLWTARHAELIRDRLAAKAPAIRLLVPALGDEFNNLR